MSLKKIFFGSKILYLSSNSLDYLPINLSFDKKSDVKQAFAMLQNSNEHCVVLYGDISGTKWKWFKDYFKTIGAAGGVVFNQKGEILLIKRRGVWDLPKGKIEKKEGKKEAALREVQEECGIVDLSIEEKIVKTYHIYELYDKMILKTTHWYKMYSEDTNLIPQAEEDIEEVIWVSPSELPKYTENTFDNIKLIFDKMGLI